MTVGIRTSDSDLPVNADFQPNKMFTETTNSGTLQKGCFMVIFVCN